MINLGNIEIADLRLGTSQVKALYLGSEQVWSGEEPGPATGPWLCFTAEEANSTVHLDKNGSPAEIYLETSTDGSTWTDYSWSSSTGDTLTLANVGDKVYMRAKTENQTIGSSSSNYYKFVMTGKIAASGNIQTLLKADGSRTDAPSNCYRNMFRECTSLTTAPALPATTLANDCYDCMFNDCTSLTTAPALPATTLANSCYQYMFYNCTSLTTAPALPATTLASGCYLNMFRGCTSLTSAPALPATTLVYACYREMFYDCSSLSSVEVAFTEWKSGATNTWLQNVAASGTFTCPAELPDTRGADNIPTGWLKQEHQEPVDTPLTFTATQANSTVKLNKVGSPRAISLETSTDGSTWTDYSWSGNTGDTLTLANVGDKVYMRAKTENQTISNNSDYYYQFVMTGKIAASGNIQTLLKADGSRTDAPANCYQYMFQDCSSLTTAPALPATTLADYCYLGIFVGCSSLTTAPALPATTLAEGCYSEMLAECSSLTTAPALPATTLANYCYQSMFSGCTSLATAPALPATTLADYCYSEMFFSCSSLTSAPALPATTLADVCYQYMFNNCTSLSSVAVSFTKWDTMMDATSYWLDGVAASGTFTCPRTLPDTRDESHIPEGWTKVNAA